MPHTHTHTHKSTDKQKAFKKASSKTLNNFLLCTFYKTVCPIKNYITGFLFMLFVLLPYSQLHGEVHVLFH